MAQFLLAFLLLIFSFATSAHAQEQAHDSSTNLMDDLNPFDPNIEQTLEAFDRMYEDANGVSPFIENLIRPFSAQGCYRESCPVWVQVVRSQQKLFLHLNGVHKATWAVSTGAPGHGTPNFDTHPNGRIYDKYSSSKYPGGDYQGLGNMPYVVFISGGFAIHGTSQGNWKKLGTRASHGCVRIHPDHAYYFNRLVRQQGIRNVWITVHE